MEWHLGRVECIHARAVVEFGSQLAKERLRGEGATARRLLLLRNGAAKRDRAHVAAALRHNDINFVERRLRRAGLCARGEGVAQHDVAAPLFLVLAVLVLLLRLLAVQV